MEKELNIIYREPEVEDAKKIVDFYNYVGGETTYLSFEKDEYPMDEEAQKGDIISTKEHPASIMILAMDGDEISVKVMELRQEFSLIPAKIMK